MTTPEIPVKENLTQISEQQFNEILEACQATKPFGFSGPFIDSAPAGSVFAEPFRQLVWIAGKKTFLFKYENLRDQKTAYYVDRDWLDKQNGRHEL